MFCCCCCVFSCRFYLAIPEWSSLEQWVGRAGLYECLWVWDLFPVTRFAVSWVELAACVAFPLFAGLYHRGARKPACDHGNCLNQHAPHG